MASAQGSAALKAISGHLPFGGNWMVHQNRQIGNNRLQDGRKFQNSPLWVKSTHPANVRFGQ
jgi:hypothetical protein